MFVIFDGHSMAYRTWYGNRRMFEGKGSNDGLFGYQVLDQIIRAQTQVEAYARRNLNPRFVRSFVVWDHPTSRDLRRKMFTGYKEGRTPVPNLPDYIAAVRNAMREAHPRYGMQVPRYEGDDIIAVVTQNAWDSVPVIIVTRDQDLMQLLVKDDVVLFDPLDKVFMTREGFHEKHGYGPQWVPLYKALCGDTSDKWKGVKGFGPVAFEKKVIAKHRTVRAAREALVEEYGDVVNLGYDLTVLPIDGGPYVEALEMFLEAFDHTSPVNWQPYLDRFGIEAMGRNEPETWLT